MVAYNRGIILLGSNVSSSEYIPFCLSAFCPSNALPRHSAVFSLPAAGSSQTPQMPLPKRNHLIPTSRSDPMYPAPNTHHCTFYISFCALFLRSAADCSAFSRTSHCFVTNPSKYLFLNGFNSSALTPSPTFLSLLTSTPSISLSVFLR